MPSPSVEIIQVNEALEQIGVKEFHKEGSVLFIEFNDGNRVLPIDIDKKALKTLKNLEDAASAIDLDAGILEKLKLILTSKDYRKYITLPDPDNEDKQQDKNKDKDKKEASSAVKAVHLVRKFCEDLLIDNLGQPYAAIKVDKHIEVIPIKSEKFKDWVSNLYFDVTVVEANNKRGNNKEDAEDLEAVGDILSSEALIRTLRVLKSKATSSKLRRELYLRVAKTKDIIYYDLVNSEWQAVKVTSEGWEIVYSPILFRRYPHQIAQVIPQKDDTGATGDTFDQFLKLLNISEDEENRLLFKCYIITLFYYGIVHAALMLHGESGAAKTAKQEMVKMIVDPSEVLTLSISYDLEGMAQSSIIRLANH